MHTLERELSLRCSVEDLWAFHRSAEALKVLTPPNRKLELLSADTRVENGAIHEMRVFQFGIPMIWRARIHDVDESGFTDTAERSPFAYWSHRHAFLPRDGGSLLRDTVQYALPLGPLGVLAHGLFVRKQLEELFAFRHAETRRVLEG